MSQIKFRAKFFLESKKTIFLFLPLLCSQITYAISTFLGTAMIAHLGQDALAAVALVSNVYTCLCAFFYGIFLSICVMVSRSVGARDDRQIERIVSQGFILAVVCAVPFMLIMWFVSPVFLWAGQDPKVIELSELYLRALSFSVLPWLFIVVLEQFLIGISLTRFIFVISLIQVPIEIFVNYAFIFGKFGFPQCGIAGLGYGFTLVFVISLVVVGIYISKSKITNKYHLFKDHGRIDIRCLRELSRIGIPIGSSNIVESLSFLVIVLLIAKLGSDALAAQGIIKQYLELTVTVALSLAQATTVRIGQSFGEKNNKAIFLSTYVSLTICVFLMSIVAIIYIVFPRAIIALDIDIKSPANAQLIHYTKNLFVIVAVFQIFDGVRLVIMSVLRGLQDTKLPMYVTVLVFWLIGFPCSYMLSCIFDYGVDGIWYGLLIGMLIGVVILVLRMFWALKKINYLSGEQSLIRVERRD